MSFEGSFEEGLLRLDELTKALDRDDLTLDESTALYRDARELGEQLHQKLDKAEFEIQDLEGNDVSVILDSEVSDHAD